MTKCPYCKMKMKIDKKPMSFKFSPNIIVQEVLFESCPKCSFECVSEEEYERVRKLVHSFTGASKKAKVIVA